MAWVLMYLGQSTILGPTERMERWRGVVILALKIHHHIDPGGIVARGVLGVALVSWRERVRVEEIQTGATMG